jgi:hypothetical protein
MGGTTYVFFTNKNTGPVKVNDLKLENLTFEYQPLENHF